MYRATWSAVDWKLHSHYPCTANPLNYAKFSRSSHIFPQPRAEISSVPSRSLENGSFKILLIILVPGGSSW